MESKDAKLIAKAIDDNTRELKKFGALFEKVNRPITIVNPPGNTPRDRLPVDIVVHRAKRDGIIVMMAAECDQRVLVDLENLTVSLNEEAINCPSCKTQ